MKRFLVFAILLTSIASIGCRGMSRLSCYRGDACDPCATTYETPTFYDSTPIYDGAIMPSPAMPAPAIPLPGPTDAQGT